MLVNLSLSPGYRLKITLAYRMSELADRVFTSPDKPIYGIPSQCATLC
jgi:hypothetical protein